MKAVIRRILVAAVALAAAPPVQARQTRNLGPGCGA